MPNVTSMPDIILIACLQTTYVIHIVPTYLTLRTLYVA